MSIHIAIRVGLCQYMYAYFTGIILCGTTWHMGDSVKVSYNACSVYSVDFVNNLFIRENSYRLSFSYCTEWLFFKCCISPSILNIISFQHCIITCRPVPNRHENGVNTPLESLWCIWRFRYDCSDRDTYTGMVYLGSGCGYVIMPIALCKVSLLIHGLFSTAVKQNRRWSYGMGEWLHPTVLHGCD